MTAWLFRAASSKVLTVLLLLSFAAQAVWVAVVARQSIYDEGYHLRSIQAFAGSWTPFIEQDPSIHGVGDLERYPSYLYHFLMSFPFRWSTGMGAEGQMVLLRVLSVAMVVAGLEVWRRVVRAMGAGPALANGVLLAVVLQPLLVFSAAGVSYDSLLFLVTAAFTLVAVRLFHSDAFDPVLWLLLAGLTGLAGVTKYSVLPYLVVVVLAVLVRQVVVISRSRSRRDPARPAGARAAHRPVTLAAAGLVALTGVALALERYGLNVLRFGTPMPDCRQVQNLSTCLEWSPWKRNLLTDAQFPDAALSGQLVVQYVTEQWIPRMLRYSTLIGVAGDPSLRTWGPHVLGLLVTITTALVVLGVIVLLPWLRRRPATLMLLAGVLVFTAVLFVTNMQLWLRTGEPASIQGRYLLTFSPIVAGALGIGLSAALRGALRTKLALLALVCVLATQGGGVMQFLVVSTPQWWVDQPSLVSVQSRLASVARDVVLPDSVVQDPRDTWLAPASPGRPVRE